MKVAGRRPVAAPGRRALGIGVLLTRAWCLALTATFLAGLVTVSYGGVDIVAFWLHGGGWQQGDVVGVIEASQASLGALTWLMLAVECVMATTGLAAAYLVMRGADSWFRLYLAAVLALVGTMSGAVPESLDQSVGGHGFVTAFQGLAVASFMTLAYLLPDGRFVPRWTRWLAGAWGGYLVGSLLGHLFGLAVPGVLENLTLAGLFVSAVGVAIYRYRRVSTDEQKRQTRLVVLALGLWVGFLLTNVVAPVGPSRDEPAAGLTIRVITVVISYLLAALIPAAIAVAVLRYRLFGVEAWVNRTLVYALLTAAVVGGYGAGVAAIGVFWPGGGRLLPLVAAVVVALLAVPLRDRLQDAVDRLVFGQRREPFAVVAALGDRLAAQAAPRDVLQSIADTIGPALKLSWVQVSIDSPPVSVDYPVGGRPLAGAVIEELPINHESRRLGRLQVATRPGDVLRPPERMLLDRLARQAGAAVQLATVTMELEVAHDRLVASVVEERHRLHRDLHDGIGPSLASIFQHLDAAGTVLRERPEVAAQLVDAAARQSRDVITDLRRLVYDLRPPDLAEHGLIGAVEDACRRLNPRPGEMVIEVVGGDLPTLPNDVELAAYRIAVEAVSNVVKHSGAGRATVRLDSTASGLTVTITDDGVGVLRSPGLGVGLRSMRERTERLGGRFEAGGDVGTTVMAELPLTPGAIADPGTP